MQISDVEGAGSEARSRIAGYGARPGGRPRRPGRARPERRLLLKKDSTRGNALGADGQSLTVPSCLPLQHTCSFMLNYSHQVYDPAERFPANLR